MGEKKMEHPYHALGEAFVSSVLAGNRGKIEGKQIGLADRLRQYAYYVQENAVEAGDALLVNDLLDAARRLEPEPFKPHENCNCLMCLAESPRPSQGRPEGRS